MPRLVQIGEITSKMRAQLSDDFEITVLAEQADPAAWLAAHGASVGYVLTNGHDGVKPEIMRALPALKAISCYGVGYDNIDADDARARGVVVTHTPDVLNAEVAITALMLTMACYRNFLTVEAHARSGDWERLGSAPLSRSLDGQHVGILGLGRIGQTIADRFAPFTDKISYHSRTPKTTSLKYFDTLIEMATQVDVLICITPGGAATKHLVDTAVLEALGPNGTLINVARGSVVDEAALVTALQNGILGWAGLDVFEHEPRIPDALKAMENVVLLPHVGSATVETRDAMGGLAVNNLIQHLKDGTTLSPVPECLNM